MKYIVKKILTSSGWYEGRNTDISEYMEWYAGEGYVPPDTVKRFLREFGGLKITIPLEVYLPNWLKRTKQPENAKYCSDIIITTNPIDNGYEHEFIEKYNAHYKASLYPVGVSTSSPDIFMDSEGTFYAMYGDIGKKAGASFEEYLIKNINDDIGWLEQVY